LEIHMTDIYQSITDQIVAALEAGAPPWVCPWQGSDADMAPANLGTRRPYRGVNVLLLNMQAMLRGYGSNRWLTYQQARGLGAQVRKGETDTSIVFFKMHELGQVGSAPPAADAERRVVPLLRTFTVFNAAQIDGLPPALVEPVAEPCSVWDASAAADRILDDSGARIRHGGARAFYLVSEDLIQLPPHSAFANAGDYYATALHELTHWTGHPDRCNRLLGRRHGIDAYAFEELIAEMGAAFLTNHCRLPGRLQHASYIASWLTALRGDKRLIFTAASQAQKAADYLLPKPTEVAAQATADALAA
jgi:antirestriction protein ArdC